MTARVHEIVFDCLNPERLGAFWSALPAVAIRGQIHEGQKWFVALEPIVEGGPIIGFQNVPENKVRKNRVHLDLQVHFERGRRWLEMTDPEGNEFCLIL